MGLFDRDNKLESQETTPEIKETNNEETQQEQEKKQEEEISQETSATNEITETAAEPESEKNESGEDEQNETASDDVPDNTSADITEDTPVIPEKTEMEMAEPTVVSQPVSTEDKSEQTQLNVIEFNESTLIKCRACKHKWFAKSASQCPECGHNGLEKA